VPSRPSSARARRGCDRSSRGCPCADPRLVDRREAPCARRCDRCGAPGARVDRGTPAAPRRVWPRRSRISLTRATGSRSRQASFPRSVPEAIVSWSTSARRVSAARGRRSPRCSSSRRGSSGAGDGSAAGSRRQLAVERVHVPAAAGAAVRSQPPSSRPSSRRRATDRQWRSRRGGGALEVARPLPGPARHPAGPAPRLGASTCAQDARCAHSYAWT
jgi:hypothetical protein